MANRHPFNFDFIAKYLNRTLFSPIGAILVSILVYATASQSGHQTSVLSLLQNHKWLGPYLAFITVKTLNYVATRLVLNNGWSADPPRWDKGNEVVVITGGAGGIGAAFVEEMSKRTKKIAVLDLAEPQYKARE